MVEIHSFLGDDIFRLETLWLLMLNPFLMDEKMLTEIKGKERGRYAKDGLPTYLPTYLPTDPVWRSVKESIAAVRPVQIDN